MEGASVPWRGTLKQIGERGFGPGGRGIKKTWRGGYEGNARKKTKYQPRKEIKKRQEKINTLNEESIQGKMGAGVPVKTQDKGVLRWVKGKRKS